MKLLKHYLNRKGQGLTEYVLLLAFIAGLAMMLNGANLGGTVKGVVNDLAALLGGKRKPMQVIIKNGANFLLQNWLKLIMRNACRLTGKGW
jgi:Flp pilus assembly pilin Flp